MNGKIKKLILPCALGTLQVLVGITAVLGGFGLVSDPSGAKMNIPLELLEHSPFTTYLIPGIVLFTIIGFGNLFGGLISFLRTKSAGRIASLLGIFLTIYISVEVWYIGFVNLSQPIYFVFGLVQCLLGWKLSKSDRVDGYGPVLGSTAA